MDMHAGEKALRTSNVHRLQPLRVLLAARDRRFMRVTSFLLTRKGYHVEQSWAADTVDAAQRHKADVVVLEDGRSRAAVARDIAALGALPAPPSVLLVTEDGGRWTGLRTVEKWTPLDALIDEIEAASRNRPTPIRDA